MLHFGKPFSYVFFSIFFFVIFFSCFFGPIILKGNFFLTKPLYSFDTTENFVWPTPGYTKINSYFGKRTSPTAGASSFHKGIDIGAPQGSPFLAICDGQITYTGFLGGGGFTITLSSNNFKITYCHVSPNFMVHTGDIVKKGEVIGVVGPKNVYGVPGNQYKDANGNPTNGATTGPHLHLGVRIEEEYIDPLSLF